MKKITKLIALILLSISILSCSDEIKAEAGNKKSAIHQKSKKQLKKTDKPKKLTPLEQEIQKMLGGEKGDEKILRKFLKGKEKKENVKFVKAGLDFYTKQNGERPADNHLITTFNKVRIVHAEMANEVVLERIKKRLKDQLKKEQKQ